MGVIDTISAGYDLVRRKPWLILLPVLLNIGGWIAPHLSIAGLVGRMVNDGLAQLPEGYPEAFGTLTETARALEEAAAGIDLMRLLFSGYLSVPSMAISGATSFFGLTKQVIEVPGVVSMLGLMALLSLAGLFLGTLYLAPIAAEVRDGQVNWRLILRRLPGNFVRLLGGLLLTLSVLMLVATPMSFALSVFGLFGQGIASLVMGFGLMAMLWVMLYLTFVPQGILMNRSNIFEAVGHSIGVVRMYFWPTMGLLLLANIITGGMMLVFERLAVNTAGALVAIVANAFVGTGLSAAIFIYYRERLQSLKQALMQMRGQA